MRIKRKNKNFSQDTKELFLYNYKCWKCGMNNWDCLHHTLGGNFEEADSPLNAAPLCNFKCHLSNGHTFTKEETISMLHSTYQFLINSGYVLTAKDTRFMDVAEDKFKFNY